MPFEFQPHKYPERPGCYIMRGEDGRVLYIGKSVNLRGRLRSYFHQPQRSPRFRELVRNVAAIEIILATNETESLTLENHLINMHQPPVNRALKREDSGFGELVLTSGPHPMLRACFRSRRGDRPEPDDDGAVVRFGPAGEWCLKTLAEFLSDRFRLRTCDPMPDEVCFRWHLGRCGGVCAGLQTEEEYAGQARYVAELFAGDGSGLAGLLRAEMERSADRLDFERAAIIEYYGSSGAHVPDELIVNRIGDVRGTAEQLRRLKGASVRITVPKRGTKRALLELCELNYAYRREAAASCGGIWV